MTNDQALKEIRREAAMTGRFTSFAISLVKGAPDLTADEIQRAFVEGLNDYNERGEN